MTTHRAPEAPTLRTSTGYRPLLECRSGRTLILGEPGEDPRLDRIDYWLTWIRTGDQCATDIDDLLDARLVLAAEQHTPGGRQ